MVLTCKPLMAKDDEHLFMCPLALVIFSCEELVPLLPKHNFWFELYYLSTCVELYLILVNRSNDIFQGNNNFCLISSSLWCLKKLGISK